MKADSDREEGNSINIYDIASEAGVSISTVSRVLNNSKKVGPETRRKVEEVLRKRHYTPNAMARGLVNKSMKTIGIMTSDVRNQHFAHTTYTLENLLFNWGFSTILCNTGNKSEKKKDYIRILAGKKVDGLILVGSVYSDIDIETEMSRYLAGVPIVVVNGFLDLPDACSVLIDHDWGLLQAVGHLHAKGHSNILFVRSSCTYNSKRKMLGFHQAMKTYGLDSDERYVLEYSQQGLQSGYDAVDEILVTRPECTALIFADDSTALAGVNRLKQKGISVPMDMAVIGYDNSVFSLYADPTLTTVDIKNEAFSTLVAHALHDLLRKTEVGSSIILRPELVVRGSS